MAMRWINPFFRQNNKMKVFIFSFSFQQVGLNWQEAFISLFFISLYN
jgi:hypothetical protein